MANAVVKIGKMASTNVDSFLKSVQLNVDAQNGSHVVLGTQVTGDLNVYNASAPTDVTKQEVLIVESPVLVEVNGMRIDIHDPRQFINPKNRPARARHLKIGDEVTITIDGFSATPTVGKYAVPKNGAFNLDPAADLAGGTSVAYEVVTKTAISIGQDRVEAYKLRVVKAV
ncbi:hypothetical protein [Paenibacillus oleatilyticus]|uniref:hypothetical protein n=1 Tax=Paenibacillus oleatilyticus TaxID=2594886 RepID=UPI001C1F268F|nr:hypothetical protein [Paenibacillus oleatilyticus]MBU7316138.1 hypothetical protein [Paenibacillus oleatilyticus]